MKLTHSRLALPSTGAAMLALGLLSGCNTPGGISLTPAQQAAIFCVVAADGTAIATAATNGGANAAANKIGNASVVACSGATQIGQIIATPATGAPATAAKAAPTAFVTKDIYLGKHRIKIDARYASRLTP